MYASYRKGERILLPDPDPKQGVLAIHVFGGNYSIVSNFNNANFHMQ